jgi:thermitase
MLLSLARIVFASFITGVSFMQGSGALAQEAQPRQIRPHQRLPDGRMVLADELKITLSEERARELSRDELGELRPVDRQVLLGLHPATASIVGRHTCSRCWLNGEPIPKHLQNYDGGLPRIARNFSALLKPEFDVAVVRTELQQHPDVERVDFKVLQEVESNPNDRLYTNQWAPPVIGLENAWDVPGRGRIRVAVIDTGVQLVHPEFQGRIVFHDGYADFDDGNPPGSGDRFDHGTHVAGIIGAERNNINGVAGFSNDIDLMVMNCATWNSDKNRWLVGNTDDAVDDAVANQAHIINCSFKLGVDLEDEVEDAYDASILLVNSAGNDTNNLGGSWESGSIALFTVTATMKSGSPGTDVFDASYSNFGPGVDLAAPGTGIYSTIVGGYGFKDGTSMAAPQVSGAAALIMSMNPLLIGDESTRDLLIRMAADKGPPGYDEQYGSGVLRLRKETLQACRDATAFVSSASTAPSDGGNYDWPWRSLVDALSNVPDGATLILNGGVEDVSVYNYPPITIDKPCTLSAIPDRPVVIGVP